MKYKYIIAEKPSLARAIAEQIKGERKDGDNCIIVNNEYMVGWLVGHVLELAEPDSYNEDFKNWKLEHLPILPESWKLLPTKAAASVLKSVEKNIKQASVVINAGDPDREGQLLVDEVLEYLNWTGETKRLLVNDPSPLGVQKALDKIVSNSTFKNLYQAGMARQRSDWLLGINLTRLYSIMAQSKGYRGVISVGRVQTPVLGLVVDRFKEIQNFKPKDFFEVTGKIKEVVFKLQFSEAFSSYLDEENRLTDKAKAEELINKINGKDGFIESVTQKEKKEFSPLPFSLSDIQIYANNHFDLSAQETLDICQSLYEKHKATTYPRSDCSYLPDEQYPERQGVIDRIKSNNPEFEEIQTDSNLKSKAFNSKKITAHHALIPTNYKVDLSNLSENELKIYKAICKRYLLQFVPPYIYKETQVSANVQGEILKAKGKQLIDLGFKKYEKTDQSKGDIILPEFKAQEQVLCSSAELVSKKTTPPKLFTEATLLSAMQNISKFVSNETFKKILKETDGIGTPATQSNIIETLFKREYVQNQKKNIIPTELGLALIDIVPEATSKPDLTAYWEQTMKQIEDGEKPFDTFMNGIYTYIPKLIEEGKQHSFDNIPTNALTCPKCKKETVIENKKAFSCCDDDCSFVVFKTMATKKLSNDTIKTLIEKGKTKELKGFVSQKEKPFSAALKLNDEFKVEFVFSESKKKASTTFKKRKKRNF